MHLPLAESRLTGSSKAEVLHRISWEVTESLTDAEMWLHEKEM